MQVSVVLRLKALYLEELLCDSLWHTLAFYQNYVVKKYLKELEIFEEFTYAHMHKTHTYTLPKNLSSLQIFLDSTVTVKCQQMSQAVR